MVIGLAGVQAMMYDSGQLHVTSNQPSMFRKEELKFQPPLSLIVQHKILLHICTNSLCQ